jgi:uncharacterized protein YegL
MLRAKTTAVLIFLFASFFPWADGVEEAVKGLRDAIFKEQLDSQRSLVATIVGFNDAKGLSGLNTCLMEVIPALRKNETEYEALESEFERRREKIDRLKLSPEETKKAEAAKAEADFKDWQDKKYNPVKKKVTSQRESREIISKGLAELTAKLGPEKRKSEIDRLGKLIQTADRAWDDRAAAMECYARLGDSGSFNILWKVCKDSQKEKKKIQGELPEKEAAFEKERARFYEQVEKQGGVYYKGAEENMKKLETEVKAIQDRLFAQSHLFESASRLIPLAIAGMPAQGQQKPIAELTAAAKGNDGLVRLAAIDILGRVPDTNIRTFLRTLLGQGDAALRVAAIEALIAQKDEGAVDIILEKCIKDEEWTVRAAAIRALAKIRSAKSVPALIAAFENEVGRLRDDAQDSLESLSGVTFNTPALWKQWWEKSQSGFSPVPVASQPAKRGPRPGDTGVAFAGIQSSSKNVAFVVDVSGSMNFGLDAEGPPREGQPTRFAMLKKELEAAIERMPDGGKAILITFSTAANLYTPKALDINAQTKKKLLDYVRTELQPNGGTNIYGALKAAFDAAGLGATDKYYRPAVDTIFFLTDGTPSPDTEITDPDRLLSYVRERNKLSKIAVHVVCLGEADASFLRKLAAQNNGEFIKP